MRLTTSIAAAFLLIAIPTHAWSQEARAEAVAAALKSNDATRNRAALIYVAELYQIEEQSSHVPESVPDTSSLRPPQYSANLPTIVESNGMLSALEGFYAQRLKDQPDADSELLALWLRAYGRIYMGVPRRYDAGYSTAEWIEFANRFPRLFLLPEFGAERLTAYLTATRHNYPPIVTQAAIEAALVWSRHSSHVFGKISFLPSTIEKEQFEPKAYVAIGLGIHPAAALEAIPPRVRVELIQPLINLQAVSGAILPVAGAASRHSDEATRQLGYRTIEQVAFTIRRQFTVDLIRAIDAAYQSPWWEIGWKLKFLGSSIRGNAPMDAADAETPDGLRGQARRIGDGLESKDAMTRFRAAQAAREVVQARRMLLLSRAQYLSQGEQFIELDLRDALGKALEQFLPKLSAALADPKPEVRITVLEAIENAEFLAWNQRDAVAAHTQDKDPFVRWVAARTLGRIRPGDAKADSMAAPVAALARMMDDRDIDARIAALNSLKLYGATARPAADAVVMALNRGDVDVRVVAVSTLETIADPKSAAAALAPVLRTGDVRVRRAAAEAFSRLSGAGKDYLPALKEALNDPDSDVRRKVGEAILVLEK